MNWQSKLARKILFPNLVLLALLFFVVGNIYFTGRHIRTELVEATENIKHQNDNLATLNNYRRDRQKAIVSYRFERDPIYLQALMESDKMVMKMMDELKTGAQSRRERRSKPHAETPHRTTR